MYSEIFFPITILLPHILIMYAFLLSFSLCSVHQSLSPGSQTKRARLADLKGGGRDNGLHSEANGEDGHSTEVCRIKKGWWKKVLNSPQSRDLA